MSKQEKILIEMEKLATIGNAAKQLSSLIISNPEMNLDHVLTMVKGLIIRDIKEHEAVMHLIQNN